MSGKKSTIDGLAVVQDVAREATHQVAHSFETVASGARQAEAAASAGLGAMQDKAKTGMEQVMKQAEQMMAFSQGNVEAMVKAGQIWATGLQDLSRQITATAQASFQDNVSMFRSLSTVRSVQDAVALQTTTARAAMEKAVSETSRLAETSMKLAEKAGAPLAARVTAAMEMVSTRG